MIQEGFTNAIYHDAGEDQPGATADSPTHGSPVTFALLPTDDGRST